MKLNPLFNSPKKKATCAKIIIIMCLMALLLTNFEGILANGSTHSEEHSEPEDETLIPVSDTTVLKRNAPVDNTVPNSRDGIQNSPSDARFSSPRAKVVDLATDIDMTIFGNNSGDMQYGTLATGDINGDNVEDLIIGAALAGDAINRSIGGEVYVIYGNQNITDHEYIHLNMTNNTFTNRHADIVIYGADKGDQAGTSVAVADFNGDNLGDIIIGAQGADGLNNARFSCGEVYVIFGNANLPTQIDLNLTTVNFSHPDHIIYGIDDCDFMGKSLAAGNVNGDSFEDLILGAEVAYSKNNSNFLAGEAYVVFGDTAANLGASNDLNTSQNYLSVYGIDDFDRTGKSVCLADTDNDGKDDIIISAPGSNGYNNSGTSPGEIYIIYGDTISNLNQTGTDKPEWDLEVQPANLILYGMNNSVTLGSALTSGDIDNDSKQDIIIGIIDGDGPPGSKRTNTGSIYLYYGDARAPENSKIINTSFENMTIIYGAETQDNAGSSLATGDLDNDNFDDIIISAPTADSYADQRLDAGEVYVIYGTARNDFEKIIDLNLDNTYSSTHWDKLIYGKRFGDATGSAMSISDFNDDGVLDFSLLALNGEGYNNTPLNVGNVHIIFGKPPLINEKVVLIDGGGPGKYICFARYKNYTFRVNVTNEKCKTDLQKVVVTLAPDTNYEMVLDWNESTKKFSAEDHSYAYLSNESYSQWVAGKNVWALHFKIMFNWSFQYESSIHCKVLSIRDNGAQFFNSYSYIFKVENDLEFIGNFTVIAESQGILYFSDWVRANESLHWTGQKVVYEDNLDVYPPNAEFNVTLWDSQGNYWNDDNSSGKNFSITNKATNYTVLSEFYSINITDIPSYCCHGMQFISLYIDGDDVKFTNATPTEQEWQMSKVAPCRITILDINGSRVDATSIDYRVSTDKGGHWSLFWINAGLNGSYNSTIVNCTVYGEFKDGTDNLIKWRAKDMVGNGYSFSDMYNISVDTINVTFENPIPSSQQEQPFEVVDCGITIKDTLSGVDATSISYSISIDGGNDWSVWKNAHKTEDNNEIQCIINEKFLNGDKNYIRWRAKDVAGNGFNVSEHYWVRVNIGKDPDAPVVTLLSPRNGYTITKKTPILNWIGTDPNNDDITYDLYMSANEALVRGKDTSVRIAQSISDSSYIPELTDRTTYYWTVIPTDGFHRGRCESGTWSFFINTTVSIPIVTMRSPFNQTVFNSTTIDLYWRVGYPGIEFVKYNVFWGNDSQLLEPKVIDNMEMTYELTDLENDTIYYWKVIPYADKIEGSCASGIWWFKIDTSFVKESFLNITGPTIIELWQGENATFNLTITNIGNFVDEIDLILNPGDLGINVQIANESLVLGVYESRLTTLKFTIPDDFPSLETKIQITAKSRGVGTWVTHTIIVTVRMEEPERPQDSDDEDGLITTLEEQSLIWVFIAIILILVILIVLLLIRSKQLKAQEKEPEEKEVEEEPKEELLEEGEALPDEDELEGEPGSAGAEDQIELEQEPETGEIPTEEAEPTPEEPTPGVTEPEEEGLEDLPEALNLEELPEGKKTLEPAAVPPPLPTAPSEPVGIGMAVAAAPAQAQPLAKPPDLDELPEARSPAEAAVPARLDEIPEGKKLPPTPTPAPAPTPTIPKAKRIPAPPPTSPAEAKPLEDELQHLEESPEAKKYLELMKKAKKEE